MKSRLPLRCLQSLAIAVLAVVLGLATGMGWGWITRPAEAAGGRAAEIGAIQARLADLRGQTNRVEERMDSLRVERSAQLLRARQAGLVAGRLAGSVGGLSGLTANPDQLREDERRLARMREMAAAATLRAGELMQESVRLQWRKDGLEIAANQAGTRLRELQTPASPFGQSLRAAWQRWGRIILGLAAVAALLPFLRRWPGPPDAAGSK